MSQRHDHDTIERLWEGAADPKSERFVPLELRDIVAGIDAATEKKLRRNAYGAQEMYRTDRQGHVPSRTLNPADNEHDAETAAIWRMVEWARQQLNTERVVAEQNAYDAVRYTCRCCDEVVPLSAFDGGRSTQRRKLIDGTFVIGLCGRCAYDAELLAAERRLTDTTRRNRLEALIAEATS